MLIENNEDVHAGQLLAIIENPANYKDVLYLKSILDTIQTTGKTFEFPMDNFPILFFGDLETDFAIFQNNYIQYQLNKELQPYENEALANKVTEKELRNRLTLLETQKETNKRELEFKENELQRYKVLFEKGVIASQEMESKQLEYLQAERNYKNMEVSLSQLKENIAAAKRNTRGNIITESSEELKLLKLTLQSFHQLKKSIRDWELQYTFQSNIEGKVSFTNIWNKNQTVNAGDLVFSIIPSNGSDFIARLKTPIQNSGKIKVGQKVNIRLENFPDEEFGILNGAVKTISLLPDSEGFYTIEVSLDSSTHDSSDFLFTSYGKKIQFTQEMRGVAEIITEDLRLIERFFYQIRNIFNN